MRDFGFEIGDRFRGRLDAQVRGVGNCGDLFWRRARAHDVNGLRAGMLGEIAGRQLVHVADLATRIVLIHHRGGDGHEQRRSFGSGGTR